MDKGRLEAFSNSVRLTLLSTLDGESTRSEYIGEYKQSDGKHTIVYTDYSGNTSTKVGIEATENAMLIHRVGGYEGDTYKPRENAEERIYELISDICVSMKALDHLQMPELVINKVEVEMSAFEKKLYERLRCRDTKRFYVA